MTRTIIIVLLAATLGGCSRQQKTAVVALRPDLLATVGDAEITSADFAEHAANRQSADTPAAREALLEEMIAEETLVQAAKAAGLDKTPAYRRAVRDFLIARLREEKLQPLLSAADSVSNESLAAAMPEAAARYAEPPARRYAWLRVADEPDARDRLDAALAAFQKLPPDSARTGFGSIAAEFSEDGDTRYQGGDLGWLADSQLAARFSPEIAAACNALQPGEGTAILPIDSGLAILTLTAARPIRPLPAADARERLRYELAEKQRAQITEDFKKSARAAVAVEIYSEVLASQKIGLPIAPVSVPAAPSQPAPDSR